jgi:nucleotide-binding universal stress UspA family protein
MSIFSRIVVGTDGSEAAESVVDFAIRLAREHDGELFVCHIVDPAIGDDIRAMGEADTVRAGEAHIVVHSRMIESDPPWAIVDVANEEGCTLIVVAPHDRSAFETAAFGRTTDAILRESTIPVLTVRAVPDNIPSRHCFERILVGIDDSEASDAALATVAAFPADDRRHVVLCGVSGSAFVVGGREYRQAAIDELHQATEHVLETARATVGSRGASFELRVVDGQPAPALIATAAEERAELIVLGSHGRRGLRRFFLGSVAENVVQSAPIPVLVVRGLQHAHAFSTDASLILATARA